MATKKKRARPAVVRHPIAKLFSEWLIDTRTVDGVSRYAVAQASGMSPATLKSLEEGCDPKLSTFVEACNAHGRKADRVLAELLRELG